MIIETQDQVTEAVLDEMKRTPDARAREILAALIRHLHGFIREVRMTETEFHEAIRQVNAIGQRTTPATTRRCSSRARSASRTSCAS